MFSVALALCFLLRIILRSPHFARNQINFYSERSNANTTTHFILIKNGKALFKIVKFLNVLDLAMSVISLQASGWGSNGPLGLPLLQRWQPYFESCNR